MEGKCGGGNLIFSYRGGCGSGGGCGRGRVAGETAAARMNRKLLSEHLSQTAAPLPLIQRTKTSALFPSLRVARVCWSPTSATSCHTATGCSCCGAAGQLPWGAGRKSPAWICPNLASQVSSGGRGPRICSDLSGSVRICPDLFRSTGSVRICPYLSRSTGSNRIRPDLI